MHSIQTDFRSGDRLCLKDPVSQVLLPILQRIGDGATSEQGLEDLYNYKRDHPEVDTNPFMARLSRDFHAFVDKGLARIERKERAGEYLTWLVLISFLKEFYADIRDKHLFFSCTDCSPKLQCFR